MARPIIEINGVSMKFNLMKERVDSVKDYFIKLCKGELEIDSFSAIDDVSMTINKGEIWGIVGLNGSGKSTLLKLIAGILEPTQGDVKVRGQVAPLIELGAGFDGDLTAKENIFLNGMILGYSKKMLKEHFDSIIEFSELREFVDVPVKNFSSGMYGRLGFAIATEFKPDILLIDEVLSVGDYKFQEKCEKRVTDIIGQGTTVVMVSHSIETIKRMCTHAAWISRGRLIMSGHAEEVCVKYSS